MLWCTSLGKLSSALIFTVATSSSSTSGVLASGKSTANFRLHVDFVGVNFLLLGGFRVVDGALCPGRFLLGSVPTLKPGKIA